jgi:hypothetical protein
VWCFGHPSYSRKRKLRQGARKAQAGTHLDSCHRQKRPQEWAGIREGQGPLDDSVSEVLGSRHGTEIGAQGLEVKIETRDWVQGVSAEKNKGTAEP